MKRKITLGLLTLVLLVSSALMGYAQPSSSPSQPTPSEEEASILTDNPDLSPLVDFVGGKKNLSILSLVGFKAADKAMQDLSFNRDSSDVLAITDAGYPLIETGAGFPETYHTTEGALDGVSATSGCTQGQGNLIPLHRNIYDDLWFFFFEKDKGKCIYIEVDQGVFKPYLANEANGTVDYTAFMDLPASKLFSQISQVDMNPSRLIEKAGAQAWQHNFADKVFGGNEFSIITLCAMWDKGINYEFIKAAELHNHICPGLTSGYFIAQYLDKNFPLEKNERYVVWAIPPWCKDDALQQMFDATVGKRGMAAMYISKDIRKKLDPKYKSIAGIYIKLNRKTGNAKAIVLGFDWNKASSDCGIARTDFKDFSTYKWWWARLRSDVLLMDHEPEEYVRTLKVEDLGNQGSVKKMMANWMQVGSNPLAELGLIPKP